MTLLVDHARDVVGMPMGSLFLNRHIGWTTDSVKAQKMRDAGAYVESVPSLDKRPEARKFDGWEVSFAVGSEVIEVTSLV